MRKTLLTSAALLGMAMSMPAFAQSTASGNPAAASSQSMPQSPNSLPPGAASRMGNTGSTGGGGTVSGGTAAGSAVGGTAGSTGMGAGTASTGMAPASSTPMHHRRMAHHPMKKSSSDSSDASTGGSGTMRAGHEPGVGDSEPSATRASNIDRADTRSDIAPRLPTPQQGANGTPEQYLHDADRALSMHRTGAAQEALERAETRLLDRSAGSGAAPGQDPMVQAVNTARSDLAKGDASGARSAIRMAMGGSGGAMGGSSMGGSSMGHSSMGGGSMGSSSMNGNTATGASAGMGAGTGTSGMGAGAGTTTGSTKQ